MELSVAEKLTVIMNRLDKSKSFLAEQTGQTRQNLGNKFKRDDFSVSEMQAFANALGCELKITFIMPNGDEI